MSQFQTALITGGSDGIGFELARLFRRHHYNVLLVSDDLSKLERAALMLQQEKSAARIEVIEADLSLAEGPEVVIDAVYDLNLEIDVLANNAGVGVYGDFVSETHLEQELRMIQLNIASVVALTKHVARQMAERGSGRILITSSLAGLAGAPWMSVYGATKAFDYIFALGLREELRDRGVTVTALLPSQTDTNFFHRAHMERSKLMDTRLADPAEVAQAGFDALMNNEDHVNAPLRSKLMSSMGSLMPDMMLTRMMARQQEPKKRPDH